LFVFETHSDAADSAPALVLPSGGLVLFVPVQDKDFKKVVSTLECIPQTGEIVKQTRSDFKKFIDKKDRLAYPLLQW